MIKPETVLPMHAINAWKQRQFVAAQAAVLRVALAKDWFSPADVPEDTVSESSRQGVASNAWNSLRALEIIDRAPMSLNVESAGIFGGRTRNTNPSAKGRWCAVYVLRSRSLALKWLERHEQPVAVSAKPQQQEMWA